MSARGGARYRLQGGVRDIVWGGCWAPIKEGVRDIVCAGGCRITAIKSKGGCAISFARGGARPLKRGCAILSARGGLLPVCAQASSVRAGPKAAGDLAVSRKKVSNKLGLNWHL